MLVGPGVGSGRATDCTADAEPSNPVPYAGGGAPPLGGVAGLLAPATPAPAIVVGAVGIWPPALRDFPARASAACSS